MKKSILSIGIYALASWLILSGCAGEYPGYKKTESGIFYKIYNQDNPDTTQVRKDRVVTLDMVYSINDSVYFDSRESTREVRFPVVSPGYEGDIYEALTLLKEGDSASFIIDAVPFFTETVMQPEAPEGVTEEDDLVFEIKVHKVQSQEAVEQEEAARMMQLQQQEQITISDYVAENEISVEPTESGIYFMPGKRGSGPKPEEGKWVSVHYSVSMLDGTELFDTRERSEDPIDFEYGKRFENEGFQEVLGMMREGGTANAIVPSEMAFGAQGAGDVVPPFTPLYYDIELADVMTIDEWDRKQSDKKAMALAEKLKKQETEKGEIQNYLDENNLVPTEQLPSGITYIETLKGDGPRPNIGDRVTVHYTGKLLDGTVFDSSVEKGEPFEFVVGRGMVIKGWDKGIPLMNVGSKGLLIVPFDEAYGTRQAGSIPPYSTLVFEVELLDMEPAAAQGTEN